MQPLTKQNHIASKVPLNLGVEDQSGRTRRGGDLYNSDAALQEQSYQGLSGH
jgi:hypothetical protein